MAQTVTIGEQKVSPESESLKFSATPTPQVENPSDSDSTAVVRATGCYCNSNKMVQKYKSQMYVYLCDHQRTHQLFHKILKPQPKFFAWAMSESGGQDHCHVLWTNSSQLVTWRHLTSRDIIFPFH